jgi:DnaA family protein
MAGGAGVSGPEQLALRLRPRSGATFANFVVAQANAATLHALHDWLQGADSTVFLLFGAAGSGRSHLLQAACAERSALYAPLAELSAADPAALFEGFDAVELVALDDIETVLMDAHWCEQLFHLFNRLAATGGKMLIGTTQAAATLSCALPDLHSRLGWGGSFRLQPLADDDRRRALQLLARERGFDLSDEVLTYLFTRFSRDLGALTALLDRLDTLSLAEQRRITIPFVRRLIDGAESGH